MKSCPGCDAILARLADPAHARREQVALATVLRTRGSAPLPCGSQALIEASGLVAGTIGGGALEAEAIRRGGDVILSGEPDLFDFPLGGPGGDDPNPICGGSVRVLLQPVTDAERRVYHEAWNARRRRQPGAVEIRVEPGPPLRINSRWHEGDADAANGYSLPIPIRPQLLVVGAGHVGQALAAHAALAGFAIAVIDDRPDLMLAECFPADARRICAPIARAVADFPIDAETSIALVTRGHRADAEALAACLGSPAHYIGMIGSRRKISLMREHFLQRGIATTEEFDRIRAPIGLDIGAETAPEIAVSILAEIIASRRNAKASPGSRAPATPQRLSAVAG